MDEGVGDVDSVLRLSPTGRHGDSSWLHCKRMRSGIRAKHLMSGAPAAHLSNGPQAIAPSRLRPSLFASSSRSICMSWGCNGSRGRRYRVVSGSGKPHPGYLRPMTATPLVNLTNTLMLQETVRCCAAMLRMGAEEAGSPAASQLERHINQFVKVWPLATTIRFDTHQSVQRQKPPVCPRGFARRLSAWVPAVCKQCFRGAHCRTAPQGSCNSAKRMRTAVIDTRFADDLPRVADERDAAAEDGAGDRASRADDRPSAAQPRRPQAGAQR